MYLYILLKLGAPVLLNFNPYKVSEISAIIQDRLMSVADPDLQEESKVIPLMHISAIEIAARKIASGGDLRKALDICR
jgi:cell division control protein 6